MDLDDYYAAKQAKAKAIALSAKAKAKAAQAKARRGKVKQSVAKSEPEVRPHRIENPDEDERELLGLPVAPPPPPVVPTAPVTGADAAAQSNPADDKDLSGTSEERDLGSLILSGDLVLEGDLILEGDLMVENHALQSDAGIKDQPDMILSHNAVEVAATNTEDSSSISASGDVAATTSIAVPRCESSVATTAVVADAGSIAGVRSDSTSATGTPKAAPHGVGKLPSGLFGRPSAGLFGYPSGVPAPPRPPTGLQHAKAKAKASTVKVPRGFMWGPCDCCMDFKPSMTAKAPSVPIALPNKCCSNEACSHSLSTGQGIQDATATQNPLYEHLGYQPMPDATPYISNLSRHDFR